MICGVGVDIVEIKRFAKALSRNGFVKRVFSNAEIRYSRIKPNKLEHYAARFAAKEAVLKALGTGIAKGITWHDVKITKSKDGDVSATLYNKAKSIARQKKIRRILVSISHSANYAAAFAIAGG